MRCGTSLRPWQGAAGQGAPRPHCLPHLQQPDELMCSERGKAWYQGLSLAASQAFHCQGHREHRLRDSKGPRVFPNHWEQATAAGFVPGHNNIPRAEAINGNVFSEGPNMAEGGGRVLPK